MGKVWFSLKSDLLVFVLVVIFSSIGVGLAHGQAKPGSGNETPMVHIVGVGPGDADLITVKAKECIQKSDVIICDSIISKKFADLLKDKEKIAVQYKAKLRGEDEPGKLSDEERSQRKNIKSVISDALAKNKSVALLDHGDPMIYGRWVWCLEELGNVKVEAGVALFHAANAALKHDVTYGATAKSVIITSNDGDQDRDAINALASTKATMVIYCLRDRLDDVRKKLAAKYKDTTNVAVVANAGYRGKESVIRGKISNICEKTKNLDLPNELIVFCGDNVVAPKVKKASAKTQKGKLYFVGMGAGDADLATLRAINLIKGSDLIINQFGFVNERHAAILKDKNVWAPEGKTLWMWFGYGQKAEDFEGADRKKFEASQKARDDTAAKVRTAIEKGQQVCILDFGDPLTYAPWSWVLHEFADLSPEVVPGISSFCAANAALKKSVTKGAHTKSVILTVPDVGDWLADTAFDFDEMTHHQTSMVIFMPSYMVTLPQLVDRLSKNYGKKTPVGFVIKAGLKKEERVVIANLDNIVGLLGKEQLPFEHLVYVGQFLK